jgi:hypothetical protein
MDGSSAYWYGVASPDEVARLTGKEILQAIVSGRLPHPPISKTLTFWLVEIGEGFAHSRASRATICSIQWEPHTAAGR